MSTTASKTLEVDAQSTYSTTSAKKQSRPVPLQLPEQTSYTTHRTVTPVLPSSEETSCLYRSSEALCSELFSPMSSHFLVPPDYEAVFSGQQTLRVSDSSPPVFTESTTSSKSEPAEDFEFSPDFNRVLAEFDKTVCDFESPKVEPHKGSDSPQLSDSDLEFFDCKQALSDFSESEETKAEQAMAYHISEPSSPVPGRSLDMGFLHRSHDYSAHPFLRGEDYKRFSSGSESLGEFAYDSGGSQELRTEGTFPVCEELPSRSQAGYYDDDDDLGRVRSKHEHHTTLHWFVGCCGDAMQFMTDYEIDKGVANSCFFVHECFILDWKWEINNKQPTVTKM